MKVRASLEILAAPLGQRGFLRLVGWALAVAGLIALVELVRTGLDPQAPASVALWGLVVALVWMCCMSWWHAVLEHALHLNEPAHMALVPGHAIALHAALGIGGLSFTVASAGAIALTGLHLALAFTLALLVSALSVVFLRLPLTWRSSLGAVCTFAVIRLGTNWSHDEAGAALHKAWLAMGLWRWAWLMLALAVAVAVLAKAFPRAGLLLSQRGSGQPRQAWASHSGFSLALGQTWLATLGMPRAWAQTWVARQLKRHSQLTHMQRWSIGLGPSASLMGCAVVWLLCIGLGMLVSLPNWILHSFSVSKHVSLALFASALMLPPVAVFLSLQGALVRSRDEQGLMQLVPGVLQGRPLARWLAKKLALQFAAVALLSLLLELATYQTQAGPDGAFMATFFWSLLACGPWAVVLLWRNWARFKPVAPGSEWAGILLVLFFPLLLHLFAQLTRWPIYALPMACALVAVGVLVWRWHKIGQEPAPFPVGRMAVSG